MIYHFGGESQKLPVDKNNPVLTGLYRAEWDLVMPDAPFALSLRPHNVGAFAFREVAEIFHWKAEIKVYLSFGSYKMFIFYTFNGYLKFNLVQGIFVV
jgi:hypothetical protein